MSGLSAAGTASKASLPLHPGAELHRPSVQQCWRRGRASLGKPVGLQGQAKHRSMPPALVVLCANPHSAEALVVQGCFACEPEGMAICSLCKVGGAAFRSMQESQEAGEAVRQVPVRQCRLPRHLLEKAPASLHPRPWLQLDFRLVACKIMLKHDVVSMSA